MQGSIFIVVVLFTLSLFAANGKSVKAPRAFNPELKVNTLNPNKIAVIQKLTKKQRTIVKAKSATAKRAIASVSASGALIGVSMHGTVGVLLDEFPASINSRIKTVYQNKSYEFWEDRARHQIEATLYRLVYRNLYYVKKGQLPLPPPEQWQFQIAPPKIQMIDDHELVTVDYIFTSTLLTFPESAMDSDTALSTIGGSINESFTLPADPEHVFERTGYACMDEEDFPPNSVDTENALSFYDDTCKGGANNFCHITQPAPKDSCVTALKKTMGRVSVNLNFTRLPWSDDLANSVRLGSANPGGADLEVQQKGLDNYRVIYRYIQPGSCAIAEGCVGGSGWRRLMQFDGSVANRGSLPAHLGDVSDSSLLVQHNMFEFSACHGHKHFSHYGTFTYGTGAQIGSKRAFCMESTQRYSNNETTPLTHPYSCHYQGIEAGWGDDYIAGIECQWVDITNVNTKTGAVTNDLTFVSNPEKFICEGSPILNANGDFTFVPTTFVTEDGKAVDRIDCNFAPGWEDNNQKKLAVTVPQEGGYITKACPASRDGDKRNCGFTKAGGKLSTCTAGQSVSLKCSIDNNRQPQVLRVCDTSKVLGVAIPCTFRDSFANATISANEVQTVSFTCPAFKSATEPGGNYSVYTAPVHVGDSGAKVNCN